MTIQDLGALGEFVGSIAILVTLGYLAVQVRLARSEARRGLDLDRIRQNQSGLELELEEHNLPARLKANIAFGMRPSGIIQEIMDRAELTLEEAWRVFALEVIAWNYRVHTIDHIDALSARQKHLFDSAIYLRYGTPSVTQFIYEGYFKLLGDPDVIQYIEDAMLASRPTYAAVQQ